jgi:hypothetical protein
MKYEMVVGMLKHGPYLNIGWAAKPRIRGQCKLCLLGFAAQPTKRRAFSYRS